MLTSNNITTPFKTEFKALNEQSTSGQRTVSFVTSADFEMNQDSAILLIKGAIAVSEVQPFKSNAKSILDLVLKINKAMIDQTDEDLLRIPVIITEVHVMREFLEAYLSHQEIIKSTSDDSAFDSNNYILARLLLVEIREWLLVRITFVD